MVQAIRLGPCDECEGDVWAPAPGVSFNDIGNQEPRENGSAFCAHYRCMDPHLLSHPMFRSWIIVMMELVSSHLRVHTESPHPNRIEVPTPTLYVPS